MSPNAERLRMVRCPVVLRLMPLRSPRHGLWQPGEQGGETVEESEGLIDRLRARLGSAPAPAIQ
jgi:hypothetical protein